MQKLTLGMQARYHTNAPVAFWAQECSCLQFSFPPTLPWRVGKYICKSILTDVRYVSCAVSGLLSLVDVPAAMDCGSRYASKNGETRGTSLLGQWIWSYDLIRHEGCCVLLWINCRSAGDDVNVVEHHVPFTWPHSSLHVFTQSMLDMRPAKTTYCLHCDLETCVF